ncbi:MAG: DUF4399 domain-containing protein [Gammaproteobacteria bacterium]
MKLKSACLVLLALPAVASDLPQSSAPPDATLYIISPRDGEIVRNPVTVRFGLRGMGVAPAGVAFDNSGHHHLLVDVELPPLDAPIPADEHHIHFGKGQTETVLTLAPGPHRLQLLLGDHLHRPHEPPVVSSPVAITVAP